MTDLRVLLATPHAGYEQRVRRAFAGNLNGDLRRWDLDQDTVTPAGLLQELAGDAPDVVAIGPDVAIEDALELARELERQRPEISVLIVGAPTPELWERAARSGVRDVLAPDAADAEVRAAFDRAIVVAERRRHNLVGDTADPDAHGRIITVVSPKGGSGKTTVASNLAVGLAMAEPDHVAAVDLDLQFGDLATALRLTPEHSVVDVARAPGALDGLQLKSFLSPHPSDLWALCGPDTPAAGEDVTGEQVQRVVRTLADEFRYVVVDTGAGLSEHTLAAIEVATDLVLVCALDVTSVRSLRKELDTLELLGMHQQRRHLLINRSNSRVGVALDDVEATLGLPVDIAVPSSRNVPLSMNQGTPVIESEPRSATARQFAGLVARFTEQPAEQGLRRFVKGLR